jgi:hypothetical protein
MGVAHLNEERRENNHHNANNHGKKQSNANFFSFAHPDTEMTNARHQSR